jgi:hypothetical protein
MTKEELAVAACAAYEKYRSTVPDDEAEHVVYGEWQDLQRQWA